MRVKLAPNDQALGGSLIGLGETLRRSGQAEAAVPLLREAMQIMESTLKPGARGEQHARREFARTLVAVGDSAAARNVLQNGIRRIDASPKPNDAAKQQLLMILSEHGLDG